MKFQIENTASGIVLGIYEGENEETALDALARDAGYTSYLALCQEIPARDGEIAVTPL